MRTKLLGLAGAAVCLAGGVLLASFLNQRGFFVGLHGIAMPTSSSGTLVGLSILVIGFFFWALWVIRRLSVEDGSLRRKVHELGGLLNDMESIITAEPGILMIWRGRDPSPQHIIGDMKNTVVVPHSVADFLAFSTWLASSSVRELEAHLKKMRMDGTAFNVSLKTLQGDLLEADGRAAGGLATLRFRPLAGERRQVTEILQENEILSKEIESLSYVLNLSPMLAWLENPTSGALLWANEVYLHAIDVESLEDAVEHRARLLGPQYALAREEETTPQRVSTVIGGQKCLLDVYRMKIGHVFAFFAVDVTEKEALRRDLDRHVRAHANLLDKLTMAIAIFGPDQRLRFYNSAYVDLWGLSPAWLDTHPSDGEILDRLRDMRKIPEQENYRAWKQKYLSTYSAIDPQESWWHLPDGQSLRVLSEQHPFGGLTYLYENVTEVIRLESRFTELISVQRETVDNLYEGVALFGTDGRLKLFNPSFCRFWSIEPERLQQEPHIDDVIEICRPLSREDKIWLEAKRLTTSLEGPRDALQGRVCRSDDMVFDYAMVPLPDGNTLVTFVDMTASSGIERALRERNEALEVADRLKTNFLSNISYELRTPLTNIIGFSEGLALGIAGEMAPKQMEYLHHIQTSSSDLLSVIDAILDLTTIDAGAMELKMDPISVNQLLESAAEAASQWLERRDLTLRIELAEDIPDFLGDLRRMRQVLSHLLSNAIGFSDAGATVRMGARRDDGDVVLWVSDTGRGIDPEYQKQVFERFHSRPVSGGHRGPGLGLSLVKSFVELHGGRVSLISRVGRGTTVVCRLPLRRSLLPHGREGMEEGAKIKTA